MNFSKKNQNLKLHFDSFHGYGNLDKAIELLEDNDKTDFKFFMENQNFYNRGNMFITNNKKIINDKNEMETVDKIIEVLDTKIRPAVARDGGDIKFKEFKDGIVKVQLQGSCSGCPSSTMTLKQGVQNLLCHYLPEVKKVEAL